MPKLLQIIALATALAGISACASQAPVITSSVAEPASAADAPASGIVVAATDNDPSCKDITGRMQLRILEIRDYRARSQSSAASRVFQKGFSAILGGTKAGTDPDGTYASDRAKLDDDNRRLVAMKCRSFDLDAELQPKDFRVTPVPTIEPPKAR